MPQDFTQPLLSDKDYQARLAANAENPFLSPRFKLWIMGIIFFLLFFHLLTGIMYPNSVILSKEFILSVSLALIAYLWTQELRDRYRIQEINASLIAAQKKLQEAEMATITSLILMQEAKDPFLKGHSSRVAQYALAIAKEKDFSHDTLEMIRRACILHDLGKLAISDSILQKPAKLTDEEWGAIKKHPQTGIDILEPLKFLFLEKKVILHHHERIDGKGYPSGLKGPEIPLESRIIAVADTFDAMNSVRIYRQPCAKEYILEELKRVAGTQLDESLVSIFLKLLEKHPDFWERAEQTAP